MSDRKPKYCVTRVPKEWPQFKTPAWVPGMSVQQANVLWGGYLRLVQRITPTPRVYSGKREV